MSKSTLNLSLSQRIDSGELGSTNMQGMLRITMIDIDIAKLQDQDRYLLSTHLIAESIREALVLSLKMSHMHSKLNQR